jgi:hypothetical protein
MRPRLLLALAWAGINAASAGTIAFTPPGSGLTSGYAAGNPVNLGLTFTANANFSVDALGFYRDPSLVSGQTVSLYTLAGVLLAQTNVLLTDPLIGNYYWKSITPVALVSGQQYVVSAFIGPNPWTFGGAPTTDPRITFGRNRYKYGATAQFPTDTAGASGSAYYGPNFTIAAVAVPDAGGGWAGWGLAAAGAALLRRRAGGGRTTIGCRRA